MSFSPADWVTAVRIGIVPPITAALWLGQKEAALALYLLAPVSDLLDGHLARLYPGRKGGADWDALADIVFGLSTIGWAYWKLPWQRAWIELYVFVLIAVVAVFVVVSLRRAGRVLLLHLWSGKLLGWAGFFWFGLSYFFGAGSWTVHLAGLAAIFYYAECTIYVSRGGLDPDGRSAFL